MLLASLFLVTMLGIVVGQSLEPSGPAVAVSTSTTVTTVPRIKKPRIVPQHWGPLNAFKFGKLQAGGGGGGAAISGSTLVVVGGTGSREVFTGPAGKELTEFARFAKPLAAPEVFALGSRVYALGGEYGGTPTASIERIDLVKRKVIAAGSFEEPLAEAGVAVTGTSVYLAGGWTGEKYATAILKFVPPGTSTLVARLPEGLRSPAVTVLGQVLYVAGGRSEQGLSKNIYAVDLSTGKVSVFGTLPQAVQGAMLIASTDGLLLVGGRTAAGEAVRSVVRIDPVTGYATQVGAAPTPIDGAVAVPAGSRTIIVVAPAGTVYRVS
ncbi:MAG TPA: hypothetical protein VGM80_11385 [Gaiellaceae bacterium]|jgi:hypothetical protein